MLFRLLSFLLLCSVAANAQDAIDPKTVAIVYNANSKESSELAFYYAKQRDIPHSNLIGLNTSEKTKISRAEFEETIQEPLRRHFTRKRWWSRSLTSDGYTIPTENKIRLLVCMYGVPFGINPQALPEGVDKTKMHAVQRSNSASVDSELSIFGIEHLPKQGALPNKYYNKNTSFSKLKELTPYVMVGRIDGPGLELCKRLIDDAIATEKQGLWGMCYLDKAHKGKNYKIGDDWLTNIEKYNWKQGIPTTLDNNKQTYLTHYPMRDAALYYGWYTTRRNGPLLDPNFKFKRGAIAIHLHSSSASLLRVKEQYWVGALLHKGAAATVGNVYEPYLQLTHQFDILNQRLQEGYCFIEAATMSIPYLSWQCVAIGDPLYRPFLHNNRSGEVADEDKFYRALSVAFKSWAEDELKISQKLALAAIKNSDARFYEVLGLWRLFKGESQLALNNFVQAEKVYLDEPDQIRMSLHIANMFRGLQKKDLAVKALKTSLSQHPAAPSSKTLQSMLDILQPPAPKPAQPRKDSAAKKQ